MIATKVGTFGGPRKKSERAQCDATISAFSASATQCSVHPS
jgi:hypothetical protein